jgi:uncharacterized protein (TIGR02594 family)
MGGTLRFGSCGRDVQRLQQLLNKYLHHFPPLPVDGRYGRRTEAEVRLYQTSTGLRVDGVAGPDTWRALEKGLVGHQRNTSPRSKGFPSAPWMAIAIHAVEGVADAVELFYQGSVRPMTEGTAGSRMSGHTSTAPLVRLPLPERGNAPWMAIAMQEVGQKEVEGRVDNPRILEYHAATTLKARSEETAWCSSFVNWCMQQAGIAGTKSAAAVSWMHWGKPSAARPGAITVIYNPKIAGSSLTASGYHVGFLLEEGASYYRLLGGNQQDEVKSWKFSKVSWRLIGYRWP